MDINKEKITLEDGRLAEKHITQNGSEKIVEIYAEEVRPMKLEQRVIERTEEVLAERIIEKLDGDRVVARETHAIDSADTKLKMREEEKYATKSDVVDAVTEAMRHLMEDTVVEEPTFKAQNVIEDRIDKKSKSKGMSFVYLAIIFAQAAFLAYYLM